MDPRKVPQQATTSKSLVTGMQDIWQEHGRTNYEDLYIIKIDPLCLF